MITVVYINWFMCSFAIKRVEHCLTSLILLSLSLGFFFELLTSSSAISNLKQIYNCRVIEDCSFISTLTLFWHWFSSYLRVFFIFSRYSFSHACVLMARIPETTWFIKEMRRSETAAVRRRSAAPA